MRKKTGQERVKRVVSYLPDEIYKRVDERAKKERRTMSTEILLLIEKGLNS